MSKLWLFLAVISCFIATISTYAPRPAGNSPNQVIAPFTSMMREIIKEIKFPCKLITNTNQANSLSTEKATYFTYSVRFIEQKVLSGTPRENVSSGEAIPNPENTLHGGSSYTPPNSPPNTRKVLDTDIFKGLLKDLLDKLDNEANAFPSPSLLPNGKIGSSGGSKRPRHINSLKTDARHCVLHGLWLSTVAGAAIELHPVKQDRGHTEVQTKIFELPDNPYPPLLTSQWTGKGIISQESPTTLTIVFQEHIDTEKENHVNAKKSTHSSYLGETKTAFRDTSILSFHNSF